MVSLAVGATASDHLEFLWRVVNLFPKVREVDSTASDHLEFALPGSQFPKVREVDSTASDHPEPVPVAFPVAFPVVLPGVFGHQIRTQKDCPRFYWLLILVCRVLWRAAQERAAQVGE